MRVMVTGGREYRDQRRIDEALDEVHAATPIEILIHGDAKGADTLAADWAKRRGVRVDPYPARWDDIDTPGAVIRRHARTIRGKPSFYNAAAGKQRNMRMIIQAVPHLVVALPGGEGTAHARAQALRCGIPVLDIDA